jgi:hypothetical protein
MSTYRCSQVFVVQEVQAVQPDPTATDAVKRRYREARLRLCTWFLEVTIFRICSHQQVLLPGLQQLPPTALTRLTSDLTGQMYAAEQLGSQLSPSLQENGQGWTGPGRYSKMAATSCGTNADTIQHSTTVRCSAHDHSLELMFASVVSCTAISSIAWQVRLCGTTGCMACNIAMPRRTC